MKKRQKNVKISISIQFAIIFTSLMIGTIVLFLLINSTFLEKFYMRNKQYTLKFAYKKITAATENSTIESDNLKEELDSIKIKYNIDIIIVNVDSQTVYSSGDNQDAMLLALWDKMFMGDRIGPKADKVIEQDEMHQMSITRDGRSSIEYLEMWGTLSNENIFLMRSTVQSIEEAARMTNIFLAITGSIVLILGVVVVIMVSRRVAKPIFELAEISEKMGQLEFEAKYNGKEKNEIGLLGANINKMSETLEATISELKVANVELQKDIKRRDEIEEMRSEFISNVSHELKTPIALIQGYAEGLVEGISEDKESRDYYCSVICDEADKMNSMVKKLLTLNELEFGNESVTMERFDIVTLIRNRIQTNELIVKQKEMDIIFSEESPIYVWGDEFKTEEVLNNYISNAINHCQGEKKIVISIKLVEEKIRVFVYNTGERIPEESISHLFEKFYKVDKARTRDYGGSGIGLSIVKAIQDSINQSYGVINEENGVSFWFELERA